MPSPSKVVWSQGLLMSPQHLQAADRYHEELLAARLRALHPLDWGVVRCSVQTEALATGQLRIEQFLGVLPGGAVLSFAGDEAEAPATRSLEGRTTGGRSVGVWLGVPRERDGLANFAGGDGSRFTVDHRSVADATAEGDPVEVGFGRPNATLLLEGERLDDYDSVKIAEVTQDETGAWRLVETYVPPALSLGASPYLLGELRRLGHAMRTRQKALLEARRERDAATIGYEQADITRYLLLQAIGTHLPVVEHLAESADLPPREAYMRLLALAGALSPFDTGAAEASLPRFEPLDLRATFEPLFEHLLGLLQATQREHCLRLALQSREDGMHLLQLDDEQVLRAGRFFLAVRGPVSESETGRLLPTLGKVASWADIEPVLSSATPGARLEQVHRPPPEIPVKAGETYFEIDASSSYWRGILGDRTLAVFLPRPFGPDATSVSLLALPQRGAERPAAVSGMSAVG